jgi:hypothetical protein
MVMGAVQLAMSCVLEGTATLEEFMIDTDQLCRDARCRIVVTRWPAPLDEVLQGRAFRVDLDFCFDEPPFTVSLVEQNGPPELLVTASN